jgi:hypothetical protein
LRTVAGAAIVLGGIIGHGGTILAARMIACLSLDEHTA